MTYFNEQPLGAPIGTEIVDLDLSEPLSDRAFAALGEAFARHPVLAFRGQTLAADRMSAFARRFGPIMAGVDPKYRHPDTPEISFLTNVDQDGGVDQFGARRASAWHYDGSFSTAPPAAAMLYGIELPAIGGGTEFADTARALERLPAALRQRIEGLQTVNHFGLGPEGRDYYDGLTPERWGQYRPVRKPLILAHPKTGRPGLSFCMIHTAGIAGMRHGEAAELLRELLAHVAQTDNVYYHRWRPGAVVLWDEHATMHRNAGDFPPAQRRIMLRAMMLP